MRMFLRIVLICIGCAAVLGASYHPTGAEGPARRQLNVSIYDQAFGVSSAGTPDPLKTYQMQYFNLQHQVFETLVMLDVNTNTVLPLLAEKWEQIDPLTIRFYLRHDVRFHNDERLMQPQSVSRLISCETRAAVLPADSCLIRSKR